MNRKFTRRQAPLPFQGQKRNFIPAFSTAVAGIEDNAVVVDLFGGSGLLSRTTKDIKPSCRVIYNDFDHYCDRLQQVEMTNRLLAELRAMLKDTPAEKRIEQDAKQTILHTGNRTVRQSRIQGLHFVEFVTFILNELCLQSRRTGKDDIIQQHSSKGFSGCFGVPARA